MRRQGTVFAIVQLLLWSGWCGGAEPEREKLRPDQIYQKTVRGTALVVTPRGHGTGWLLDKGRGLVVTNAHVVRDLSAVHVRFPDFDGAGRPIADLKSYEPKPGLTAEQFYGDRVLGTDTRRDLALVRVRKVPEHIVELKLAAKNVEPRARVFFVGNPGDRLWERNEGTVVDVADGTVRVATPIYNDPGASGSPTVNEYGELVGVLHARLVYGAEESHSVDLDELQAFLAEKGITRRTLASRQPAERPVSPAERHNQAGQQRHFDGAYAQAIAEYSTAIKLKPDYADAYRNRGVAQVAQKDLDRAIADYSEAIRLNDQDAEAHYFRGLAHSGRKQHSQAIADFLAAMRRGQSDPGILRFLALAYNERGAAYSFAGDDTRAQADYSAAIQADGRLARPYRNRGAVYLRQGKYAEAVADFTRAIQNDPDYVRAYRERSEALSKLGRAKEAEADLREAAKREEKLKAASSR